MNPSSVLPKTILYFLPLFGHVHREIITSSNIVSPSWQSSRHIFSISVKFSLPFYQTLMLISYINKTLFLFPKMYVGCFLLRSIENPTLLLPLLIVKDHVLLHPGHWWYDLFLCPLFLASSVPLSFPPELFVTIISLLFIYPTASILHRYQVLLVYHHVVSSWISSISSLSANMMIASTYSLLSPFIK